MKFIPLYNNDNNKNNINNNKTERTRNMSIKEIALFQHFSRTTLHWKNAKILTKNNYNASLS